jgi:hypothetical protein
MEAKEIKLTFKCDIATFDQRLVKDLDLLTALSIALNKELALRGLVGNQELRLEGLTG